MIPAYFATKVAAIKASFMGSFVISQGKVIVGIQENGSFGPGRLGG